MMFSEMINKRVVVPETYLLQFKNLDITDADNGRGNVVVNLMNDDGSTNLTCMEFGDAFKIIFSDEFREYCKLVNELQDALYTKEEKREELADFISGYRDYSEDERTSYQIISEYDVACTECQTLIESRIEDKNALIDKCGWSTWVDVCRLYECIFQVPRENL